MPAFDFSSVQTVNPVGPDPFVPDVGTYKRFVLHWTNDSPLVIDAPTGAVDGDVFVVDIKRHAAETPPEEQQYVEWDSSAYFGQLVDNNGSAGLWPGAGMAVIPSRRHVFMYLDGRAYLLASHVTVIA